RVESVQWDACILTQDLEGVVSGGRRMHALDRVHDAADAAGYDEDRASCPTEAAERGGHRAEGRDLTNETGDDVVQLPQVKTRELLRRHRQNTPAARGRHAPNARG